MLRYFLLFNLAFMNCMSVAHATTWNVSLYELKSEDDSDTDDEIFQRVLNSVDSSKYLVSDNTAVLSVNNPEDMISHGKVIFSKQVENIKNHHVIQLTHRDEKDDNKVVFYNPDLTKKIFEIKDEKKLEKFKEMEKMPDIGLSLMVDDIKATDDDTTAHVTLIDNEITSNHLLEKKKKDDDDVDDDEPDEETLKKEEKKNKGIPGLVLTENKKDMNISIPYGSSELIILKSEDKEDGKKRMLLINPSVD